MPCFNLCFFRFDACPAGGRLPAVRRHTAGHGLGLFGLRGERPDFLQQLLELCGRKRLVTVEIIDNVRHIVAVLGLVKLRVEHNALEKRLHIRLRHLVSRYGNAHQQGLAGGNISVHVVQIEHQAFGRDHVIVREDQRVHHAAEHAYEPSAVHRARENLPHGHLGGNIIFHIAGLVQLRKHAGSKTRDFVVGDHSQGHGVDSVVRLELVDQIGIGTLVFKCKIIHERILLSIIRRFPSAPPFRRGCRRRRNDRRRCCPRRSARSSPDMLPPFPSKGGRRCFG